MLDLGGVVELAHGPSMLGALDRSGALSLATLDDEPAPVPASDGTLPASMGPAAARPAKPARSRNEPLDPFAPPGLATAEPLLELADDEQAYRARRQASVPPAMTGEAARPSTPAPAAAAEPARRATPAGTAAMAARSSIPATVAAAEVQRTPSGEPRAAPSPAAEAMRRSTPSTLASGTGGGPRPGSEAPRSERDASALADRLGGLVARLPVLASLRVRFATGVGLAILLGFVPAHLVAGWRERSAFAAIDSKIAAVQAAAATPDSYAALDAFRAEQLDAKYSARRSIVVTSLLIWAAAGAALAYGWFRRLPWDPRR